MLAMLADAINDALAHGYAGLWATGDMTWELSGICQYHRDTLPEDALQVALSKHRESI